MSFLRNVHQSDAFAPDAQNESGIGGSGSRVEGASRPATTMVSEPASNILYLARSKLILLVSHSTITCVLETFCAVVQLF